MKKIFVYHACMRALSLLSLLLVIFVSVLSSEEDVRVPWTDTLFLSLVSGNLVLAMYPDASQRIRFSLFFSAGAILLFCAAVPFGYALHVAVFAQLSYSVFVTFGSSSKLGMKFKNENLWSLFENYALMFYNVIFLDLCIFYGLASPSWAQVSVDVALFLLLVVRYLSAYTGWTFLVSHKQEMTIKNTITGFLRGVPVCDIPEGQKLSEIYARVLDFMDKEKPFLDSNCDLISVAGKVFSNKTYLSRSINYYSGKNFKQFINYYRVQYSIELMKEHPEWTIVEYAINSGFNSTVSYNLAFKTNMNDTPSNYCREYVMAKRLSR